MTLVQSSVFRGPGEGQAIPRDRPMLVKAATEDTGGAYAMLECVVSPGEWTTRHIHHNEEEAWYVLEGELTFQLAERTERAFPGSYALVPRGTLHAFGNTGAKPAKCLIIFSPPGLERMFAEAAVLRQASPNGEPDPQELAALFKRYGFEIVERGRANPY